MTMHGSCAALDGAAVLVTGPAGSGKSDLVLRLLDRGFRLVADDRVCIAGGIAEAPEALRGLLEIRGIGILRLDFLRAARVRLVVRIVAPGLVTRLPVPVRDEALGVPALDLDGREASAAQRVELALACVTGAATPLVGAFAR